MTSAMNLSQLVLQAPTFHAAQASLLGGHQLPASNIAARAGDVAAALRQAGAEPDEPVVLYISNGPEDLAGLLGIWLVDAVAVPVHVETPTPTIETLLRRLGSRYTIRSLALETSEGASPPQRPLLRGAALIVFTSGSTGTPKGVVVSHHGFDWKLQVLHRMFQLAQGDTVVVSLQLTFIFGLWVSLLALMSGARLVLAPKLSANGLRQHAPAASILATVPTALRALCTDDPLPDLPTGVGELQISSPAVMSGYLDDPGQTAAAFDDGYFKTGDLVSEREDGFVQLVGRSKDIISRGGNKIAPLEIENLFAQHSGVTAALAFGMPDITLGERLHLMVVSRDPTLDETQLRAWSAERLERFKTPDVFHFVDTIPVGRTGKADRAAARAELSGRRM